MDLDDTTTDPAALADFMRHLARDIESGRFPSWAVGRFRRALEVELPVCMSVRREAGRTTRSNVVSLRKVVG